MTYNEPTNHAELHLAIRHGRPFDSSHYGITGHSMPVMAHRFGYGDNLTGPLADAVATDMRAYNDQYFSPGGGRQRKPEWVRYYLTDKRAHHVLAVVYGSGSAILDFPLETIDGWTLKPRVEQTISDAINELCADKSNFNFDLTQ